jgi:hypothetical protein
MTMTPIFDSLHREVFTEQCPDCINEGRPVGWFFCLNDDVTCTDF